MNEEEDINEEIGKSITEALLKAESKFDELMAFASWDIEVKIDFRARRLYDDGSVMREYAITEPIEKVKE